MTNTPITMRMAKSNEHMETTNTSTQIDMMSYNAMQEELDIQAQSISRPATSCVI